MAASYMTRWYVAQCVRTGHYIVTRHQHGCADGDVSEQYLPASYASGDAAQAAADRANQFGHTA